MLTIPESIKALFKTDGVRKNFRVHFPNGELPDITNENVVRESLHFTESLCSQDPFKFGLSEASVIEFETVGVGNMYGMTIEAGIEIDTSSLSAADITAIDSDPGDGVLVLAADSDLGYGFYRVPLGSFKVTSCPRDHQNMAHRKVTAYSSNAVGKTFPYLPTQMLAPGYQMSASVFSALLTGNIRKDMDVPVSRLINPTRPPIYCYDPLGNQYQLNFYNITLLDVPLCNYSQNTPSSPVSIQFDDFFSYELNVSMSVYEGFGRRAAAALEEAARAQGVVGLIYDKDGNAIFGSTQEMLEARCPWLFSPCLCLAYGKEYGSRSTDSTYDAVAVPPGQLAPVFCPKYSDVGELPKSAFSVPYSIARKNPIAAASGVNLELLRSYLRLLTIDRSTYLTWSMDATPTGAGGSIVQCSMATPATVPTPTVSLYYIESPIEPYIDVEPSGYDYSPFEILTSNKKLKNYQYAESVDFGAMAEGEIEIEGKFFRIDRMGGNKVITLDPASPVSVDAGDFHGGGCWWDEYDVSPIGTVTATVREEGGQDVTADIRIQSGASIYDMTDNSILKSLHSADLSTVKTKLSGDFMTNAANVGFTPAELTMQGWPWIEAGDALEITVEDGTVIDTYALRVEMSGIQLLTMDIESKGGEIIGEVE